VFDDGRKDGLGTYTWSNHENMEKYVGEFTNGEFGKKGKIYYKSGQIYEGEIYDDYYYGKGVKTLPDGSKYEGVWSRRKDDIISKWKIKGYDKYGEIVLEIISSFLLLQTPSYLLPSGKVFTPFP
jgi:hypothetical protein